MASHAIVLHAAITHATEVGVNDHLSSSGRALAFFLLSIDKHLHLIKSLFNPIHCHHDANVCGSQLRQVGYTLDQPCNTIYNYIGTYLSYFLFEQIWQSRWNQQFYFY